MELSGKLTFNRIAIKVIEISKKSKSGIILSEVKEDDGWSMFEDHPNQGVVVGVGNDVTVCKPGDTVLIKGGINATGLLDKGTLYSIIYEGDVLLVREKE
jgi:co-chaperonin GroES (HSP10)